MNAPIEQAKIDPETGEYLTGDYVTPTFLRTPFNYDRDRASDLTGLSCPEPTLAQQQFKDDADINVIVERFHITGQLPENVRVPLPEDFVQSTNLQEALNTIRAAEEAFAQMPANVRTEFANDPARFMDFVHNPDNRERAAKLGIVNLPPAPPPQAPPEKPGSEPGGVT